MQWYSDRLRDNLGTERVRVVRCAWSERDEEAHVLSVLMIAELAADAQHAPVGWTWFRGDPNSIERPWRDRVVAWLDERGRQATPVLRSMWAREYGGWHDDVRSWIDRVVDQHGSQRTGEIEQVKSWGISCVLRVETAEADAYFKSSLRQPLFVNEARFGRAIARVFPGWVPDVLGADERRGWLLTADVGQTLRRQYRDDPAVELRATRKLLEQTVQMQRVSAGLQSELLSAGAIDRRPGVARRQIETVLSDTLAMQAIDDDTRAELMASIPTIGRVCRDLSSGSLPNTLVHGDLHLGNVSLRDDRMVVFDWTDACIAHALVDMLPVWFEDDDVRAAALRDAVERAWGDRVASGAWPRLWSAGRVAFELHQTITYWSIHRHLEHPSRDDLWSALPWHAGRLRAALRAYEADAGRG